MEPEYSRRNIVILGRRTSLRLEKAYWVCLEEICRREKMDMNELCARLDERRKNASRASLLRVFAVLYFQAAANLTARSVAGSGEFIAPDLEKVLAESPDVA